MIFPKINSLILQGPTNTGKTLMLSLLLETTKPTRISREKDRSNFHLDQLPSATSVIFEEPIIDQTTVGNWKLLLEGSPLPTDIKHSDKELINRIPIFITSNHDIWTWISPDDIPTIKQRIIKYDK
jgi:predicted small metal-binding protein